jgi:hypothetical protein
MIYKKCILYDNHYLAFLLFSISNVEFHFKCLKVDKNKTWKILPRNNLPLFPDEKKKNLMTPIEPTC